MIIKIFEKVDRQNWPTIIVVPESATAFHHRFTCFHYYTDTNIAGYDYNTL